MVAVVLVVMAGVVQAGEPGRSFSVEGAPPSSLAAESRVVVPVRVRNEGAMPWPVGRSIRLSYHWLAEDGAPVIWDGIRTAMPLPVGAGECAEVRAQVRAPGRPGRYLFQWDVVEEHVCWFSRRMREPPPAFGVEVRPAVKVAFTARSRMLPVMLAGGRRTVEVTLHNRGGEAWEAGRPIRLAYHWLGRDGRPVVWDGLRTAIPLPVPAGGTVRLRARIKAPEAAGLLRLQWDVVEEGVRWFSEGMQRPPPASRILVLPDWPLANCALAGWALAWLALVRRREGGVVGVLALGDVAWLVTSLAVKQAWVLSQGRFVPWVGTPLTAVSFLFLVAIVLLLLPQRFRPWASWSVGVLVTLMLWGDALYVRYFQDLPSFALMAAAGQTGQVTGSIRALVHPWDPWVLLDLLPALALARRLVSLRPARRLIWAARVVCVLALLPALAWMGRSTVAVKGRDVQRFSSLQLAQRVGVVGYHLVDGWGRVKDAMWGMTVTRREEMRVLELLERRRELRAGSGAAFGAASGANVILLQVESLQGFLIGYTVNGREVTPTLNRLAREGVYLSQCTDQTAYGRTSDAELLSQTSLLPASHGAACFRHGDNGFVSLAGVLAEQGYTTLSAVPFLGRFWNRRVTHPAFGFTTTLFDRDFRRGRVIGWGLNDRDFLAQMVPRLEGLRRPFLAYLITLSLHHPFEGFPRELEELDVGEYAGTPFGGYLHAMHYFDTALEAFLEALRRDGLLDDTVLVIWGDHDAGFPWDARHAAAIGIPSRELVWYLEDRVPVIFSVPPKAGIGGLRIERPAGLWDVPPTVAALLGVDPAPLPWLGRNLAAGADAGPVVRPGGSWIGPRLLWTGSARQRCYDWRSGREVPAGQCTEGNREAGTIAEAGDLILKGDLQGELRRELSR